MAPLSAPLQEWLEQCPQQQQQILESFRSENYRWFLWNALAAAVADMHALAHGRSQALGCEVGGVAGDEAVWGPLGDVSKSKQRATVLVAHVRRLLSCLRAHLLYLPSEQVFPLLVDLEDKRQQVQQQQLIQQLQQQLQQRQKEQQQQQQQQEERDQGLQGAAGAACTEVSSQGISSSSSMDRPFGAGSSRGSKDGSCRSSGSSSTHETSNSNNSSSREGPVGGGSSSGDMIGSCSSSGSSSTHETSNKGGDFGPIGGVAILQNMQTVNLHGFDSSSSRDNSSSGSDREAADKPPYTTMASVGQRGECMTDSSRNSSSQEGGSSPGASSPANDAAAGGGAAAAAGGGAAAAAAAGGGAAAAAGGGAAAAAAGGGAAAAAGGGAAAAGGGGAAAAPAGGGGAAAAAGGGAAAAAAGGGAAAAAGGGAAAAGGGGAAAAPAGGGGAAAAAGGGGGGGVDDGAGSVVTISTAEIIELLVNLLQGQDQRKRVPGCWWLMLPVPGRSLGLAAGSCQQQQCAVPATEGGPDASRAAAAGEAAARAGPSAAGAAAGRGPAAAAGEAAPAAEKTAAAGAAAARAESGGSGAAAGEAAAASGAGRGEADSSDGVVSLAQLQLVINMLLTAWPSSSSAQRPTTAAAAATEQRVEECTGSSDLPVFQHGEITWGGLMLLMVMLQEAPADVKSQLLEQREGGLLLQLLYRVLLEQEEMGGKDWRSATLFAADSPTMDLHCAYAANAKPGGFWAERRGISSSGTGWDAAGPMCVVQLVLMILQGMLFVVDPWTALGPGEELLDQSVTVGVGEGEAVVLRDKLINIKPIRYTGNNNKWNTLK